MATMYSYYRMMKYGYTVTLGATSMKLVPDMIMTSVDEQGRLTIPSISQAWPAPGAPGSFGSTNPLTTIASFKSCKLHGPYIVGQKPISQSFDFHNNPFLLQQNPKQWLQTSAPQPDVASATLWPLPREYYDDG
jgi:hypothetical protein